MFKISNIAFTRVYNLFYNFMSDSTNNVNNNTNNSNVEGNSGPNSGENLNFLRPAPPQSAFVSPSSLLQGGVTAAQSMAEGKSLAQSMIDGSKVIIDSNLGPVAAEGFETAIKVVRNQTAGIDVAGGGGGKGNRFGPRGGGSDPDFPGASVSGGGYHSHSQQSAGVPIKISWNTPIDPRCGVSRYKAVGTYGQITMHVTGAKLVFPTTPSGDLVPNFVNGATFTEMFYKLQRAVSYSLPPDVTVPNLIGAMNALLNALQVYYHFSSILQVGDQGFLNDSVEWNRSNFNIVDYNNLILLRRELNMLPIPPNMRQTCQYLMAHYSTGSQGGCTLLKISPVPMVTTNFNGLNATVKDQFLGFDSSAISTALGNTSAGLSYYNNIWNALAQACPGWIEDVGNMPIAIEYSPQFVTLFGNLPYILTDSTSGTAYSKKGPEAANSLSEINYFSWSADLDGGIFALSSVYNLTNNLWTPSLMMPVTSTSIAPGAVVSNRFTFNGSNYGYINTGCDAGYAYATNRPESYIINRLGSDSHQKSGTSFKLNVTGNSISNTAIDMTDWLMCLSDIKPRLRKDLNNKGDRSRK